MFRNGCEKLKYCNLCGRELMLKTLLDDSEEMYCEKCDHVYFDSPSPAIILLVQEDGRVLLTRSVGWKHVYWGLIAGHVKTGETAEEAAIREAREEVGIEIYNLTILGTYLHKARNTLMIAFMAETNMSQLSLSKELEDAAWFQLYVPLPLRPQSIAAQVVKQASTRTR
jgi:NAD+ diphosphatase